MSFDIIISLDTKLRLPEGVVFVSLYTIFSYFLLFSENNP